MATLGVLDETFQRSSFSEPWKYIGSGGFGKVYKARHKRWGFVAIKILHDDTCILRESKLWREAKNMEEAACDFVLRLYGLYNGAISPEATTIHRGIVMEFMERGSVQTLLTALSGPPPWPLAFRIAHQIALGMDVLHSCQLLHHDLHPHNVLLDAKLNAKLADFGLSRISTSISGRSSGTNEDKAGFYKYKPPEAFELCYSPSRAYDRYSYGILLWTILTGQEVYPGAEYSDVALRIPEGDRPLLEDIDVKKASGLNDMVQLMENLWDKNVVKRKTFKECIEVTGRVFSLHETQIDVTVYEVLMRLDSQSREEPAMPRVHRPLSSAAGHSQSWSRASCVSATREGFASAQGHRTLMKLHPTGGGEDVGHLLNQCPTVPNHAREKGKKDKAQFVADNKFALINSVDVVMAITDELRGWVPRETYKRIFQKELSEDQMRVLYLRVLDKGSDTVNAAFYDALKKHQFSAIEKLEGS